uniref:Amino acid permease/ SLC12A domain-containing protein n=1 Tax=Phlebotomus papatasi TaxID=29031 RepID=A0A1B0DGR5_PHLPP
MLSPTINNMSTNTDPGDTETVPIAGNRRLWRNFGGIFSTRGDGDAAGADGYVEFGISDPERSQGRTLGTFAGVFSPVALSMFSALIFIRVGSGSVRIVAYIFMVSFCISAVAGLMTLVSGTGVIVAANWAAVACDTPG